MNAFTSTYSRRSFIHMYYLYIGCESILFNWLVGCENNLNKLILTCYLVDQWYFTVRVQKRPPVPDFWPLWRICSRSNSVRPFAVVILCPPVRLVVCPVVVRPLSVRPVVSAPSCPSRCRPLSVHPSRLPSELLLAWRQDMSKCQLRMLDMLTKRKR